MLAPTRKRFAMTATLFAGFLLSLSLCLDIGIVNVAIIDAGLRRGALAAFLVGLGSCVGDLIYATASAAGVAWLLQYRFVQWLVWVVGTCMLLFLAGKMAHACWNNRQGAALTQGRDGGVLPRWALLRQGVLLALASPSAILWFAAAGAGLIAQATAGESERIPVFLLGFFLGGLFWSAGLALLVGRGAQRVGRHLRQVCQVGSALLFFYLALKVGSNGYTTLLVN